MSGVQDLLSGQLYILNNWPNSEEIKDSSETQDLQRNIRKYSVD